MTFTKPSFEVADIIINSRKILESKGKLNTRQKKVFTNLSNCRTQKLGYHKDKCDNPDCSHEHIAYNSCRDRHCPKCNGLKREKWVKLREQDLLPVTYFHVVFTVPDTLNPLFLKHQELMYKLLFKCAWQTIKQFGLDYKHLGAKTGMIALLHTWGQNIAFHPHIHCIIPGGGITQNNTWRKTKNKGKFLYPVKALSKVFRGKFTDELIKLDKKGIICLQQKFMPGKKYLHPLYKNKWVIYAKLPMHNPMQVVNYIGRYSHRIAISNHRIKKVDNGKVEFSYFNYKTFKTGTIKLSAEDFLMRFALHVLPAGFMKIRHYGILGARNKKNTITTVRQALGNVKLKAKKAPKNVITDEYGRNIYCCPVCKTGKMIVFETFRPKNRGSPHLEMLPNYDFCSQ
jgi:hypothetical protein